MSRQRDAELDRLWSARESARQRQQAAWEAQQAAYADQQAAWETYMDIRRTNGPRIDSLNAQQERADQGHAYKAESQTFAAERRQLVSEIRTARERFYAVKPAFKAAKDEFARAQQTFHSARAEHERAQDEFKRAKAEFDLCTKAFKARLDELKSASRKQCEEIAAKAGVPLQYQDDVWISTDSYGNTNIYFGGIGKPDGPGHGHYTMNQNGTVTYRRDPHGAHGAQNFTEAAQW